MITPFHSLSLATMAEDESLLQAGSETCGLIDGLFGSGTSASPAGTETCGIIEGLLGSGTLASPAGSMRAKKEEDSLSAFETMIAAKCHLLKVPQEQLLSDMRKTIRSGISKYIRDKIPISKKKDMPSTSMR